MYEYKCEYMNIHSDCSWQFAGITHVLQKRQYQLEKRTYNMNMIDLIEMQKSKLIKIDKIYFWYIRNNLTQAQCDINIYVIYTLISYFICQNLSLMSGLRAGAHCMWNQVRSLFGFMWIKRISCKPEVYARWTRLTGCQKRNTHNLACFQRKSLIKTVEKELLKSCKTKWRQPAPFFNAIYLPHAREHSHICCYHAIVRARVCPCALYTLHNQLTVCRSYSDVSDV